MNCEFSHPLKKSQLKGVQLKGVGALFKESEPFFVFLIKGSDPFNWQWPQPGGQMEGCSSIGPLHRSGTKPTSDWTGIPSAPIFGLVIVIGASSLMLIQGSGGC